MVDIVRPKFSLGRTLATPGALRVIEEAGQSPAEFLDRHIIGDWGEVCAGDGAANEESLRDGSRMPNGTDLDMMIGCGRRSDAVRSRVSIRYLWSVTANSGPMRSGA